MKQLKSLGLNNLPNDVHCNFMGTVVAEIANAGVDVKDAVNTYDTELIRLHEIELANMHWQRKSDLTAKITDANRRLDKAVSGFSAQVEAARRSFQPSISEVAVRIHDMLHRYKNVTRKAYNGEIEDVRAILFHLNGDRAADVQTLGLTEWIPQITAPCDELAALLKQRDRQMAGKPEMNFHKVRIEIDKVYRQIVTIINGGVVVRLSIHFDSFVEALNPEIERLNNQFHQAKIDIAHAEPASIEKQPYTGRHCTPVPDVLYVTGHHETVRLELGKDFNVSYKNNVEVGNATCIVHGIGAYRGKKIITFIISR
ncbi:MAG: DUF6261 family protein [Dysgonamonadaceae bacterium]|jgi:hypothetical protein|nr:DUF6261 family protein [Dysgonamonadaceae bacterium]